MYISCFVCTKLPPIKVVVIEFKATPVSSGVLVYTKCTFVYISCFVHGFVFRVARKHQIIWCNCTRGRQKHTPIHTLIWRYPHISCRDISKNRIYPWIYPIYPNISKYIHGIIHDIHRYPHHGHVSSILRNEMSTKNLQDISKDISPLCYQHTQLQNNDVIVVCL